MAIIMGLGLLFYIHFWGLMIHVSGNQEHGGESYLKKLLHFIYILGLYRDNGKENGNYCSILGLYRDNGKEHGNYYSILFHVYVCFVSPKPLTLFTLIPQPEALDRVMEPARKRSVRLDGSLGDEFGVQGLRFWVLGSGAAVLGLGF